MMSTLSWKEFIASFSHNNRLLLLDFKDQGQSTKMNDREYQCSYHVGDILELFDYLNIDKIHLVGVSYGGQVALEFVRNNQERLKTLQLITVIPKVNNYLYALGNAWEVAAKSYDGENFFSVAIPTIYSSDFYEKNLDWLNNRKKAFKSSLTPEWFDAFIRLSQSAKNFNCEDVLDKINIPTLLISGGKDIITPPCIMKEMYLKIKNSTYLEIPDAGHAAFLEKPREFITSVLGFIAFNK